jgi:hypothetical protein
VLVAARESKPTLGAMAMERAVVVEIQAGGGRRVIVVNFGERTAVPVMDAERLEIILHSGEARFGGNATSPQVDNGSIELPGHHGAIFRWRAEPGGALPRIDAPTDGPFGAGAGLQG